MKRRTVPVDFLKIPNIAGLFDDIVHNLAQQGRNRVYHPVSKGVDLRMSEQFSQEESARAQKEGG